MRWRVLTMVRSPMAAVGPHEPHCIVRSVILILIYFYFSFSHFHYSLSLFMLIYYKIIDTFHFPFISFFLSCPLHLSIILFRPCQTRSSCLRFFACLVMQMVSQRHGQNMRVLTRKEGILKGLMGVTHGNAIINNFY